MSSASSLSLCLLAHFNLIFFCFWQRYNLLNVKQDLFSKLVGL